MPCSAPLQAGPYGSALRSDKPPAAPGAGAAFGLDGFRGMAIGYGQPGGFASDSFKCEVVNAMDEGTTTARPLAALGVTDKGGRGEGH